ncbi:hypothetical protein Y032_0001g43 [Ancylostoma ceylanicum]|nr:hypothetical protein Y032_0001g43 [Ancylostoma ceylanicum]
MDERRRMQRNLQLLSPMTTEADHFTGMVRLSDVIEELLGARLPQIPPEALRFLVYEVLACVPQPTMAPVQEKYRTR